jgi:hypothetical protein
MVSLCERKIKSKKGYEQVYYKPVVKLTVSRGPDSYRDNEAATRWVLAAIAAPLRSLRETLANQPRSFGGAFALIFATH